MTSSLTPCFHDDRLTEHRSKSTCRDRVTQGARETAEAQGKRCRDSRESAVLKQARAVQGSRLGRVAPPPPLLNRSSARP